MALASASSSGWRGAENVISCTIAAGAAALVWGTCRTARHSPETTEGRMWEPVAALRRARGYRRTSQALRGGRRAALEPLERRVLLSTVVGRFVFYNESTFDGNGAAADARDVAAIAPDKFALFPGHTATFANYTSYSRGINGVAFDIAASAGDGAPGALGPHDLIVRAGTGADPEQWAPAPAPVITRLAPAPGSGTVRYLITWAAGAIRNQWLQVTIKSGGATGLAVPDVFYFGNIAGDTGGATATASVDAQDVTRVRQRLAGGPADASEPCDVNRDGQVHVIDLATVRAAVGKPSL